MPFVFVEYYGRLGNQMFQYASARALADKINGRVVHSDWAYRATTGIEPEIYKYQIGGAKPSLLDKLTIKLLTGRSFRKLSKPLERLLPRVLVANSEFDLIPSNLPAKSCYLRGYWQSYLNFAGIECLLDQEFVPRDPLSRCAVEICDQIAQSDSMAMHIRRGDYVNDQSVAKVFVSYGQRFLDEALGLIRNETSVRNLFVFSDDPAWCKDSLSFDIPHNVVELPGRLPWEEQYVMSKATNLAISASTFSWWAGWRVARQGGRVVAPRIWRSGATNEPPNFLPMAWQLI